MRVFNLFKTVFLAVFLMATAHVSLALQGTGTISGPGTLIADPIAPNSTQTYAYNEVLDTEDVFRWIVVDGLGTIDLLANGQSFVEVNWKAVGHTTATLKFQKEIVVAPIEIGDPIERFFVDEASVTIHFVDCPVISGPITITSQATNEFLAGATGTFEIAGVDISSFVNWRVVEYLDDLGSIEYGSTEVFTFPSSLEAGNYTLSATVNDVCGNTYVFTLPIVIIDPCFDMAVLDIQQPENEVCINTNRVLELTNADMDAYTFTYTSGVSEISKDPVAGTITVEFTGSGPQTVTGTPNNSLCPSTVQYSSTISGPIESVTGNLVTCKDFTHVYTVTGGDDAGVNWTLPAGVIPNYLNAEKTEVELTFENVGSIPITVSNANSSCATSIYNFTVEVRDLNSKVTDNSFSNTQLSANNASPIPLDLTANSCLDLYGDCTANINQIDAYLSFSLGQDNHVVETNDELASIRVNIAALDEAGIELFSVNDVLLSLHKIKPLKVYHLRLLGSDAANVRTIRATPVANSYNAHANIDASLVSLDFYYEEQKEIDAANAVLELEDPIILEGRFEQTFEWSVKSSEYSCEAVPAYQIQMMRVYGSMPEGGLDENAWKGATSIYSESSETSLLISIAEGSGLYAWRVRPIGSLIGDAKYALSNPANWNDASWVSAAFTFIQPDEEKNFIYSRTFTEENRVSEQLSFANGVGQTSQTQVKIHGATDEIVATQTLQDFVGRDVLTALPVPLNGVSQFGYQDMVISNGATTFNKNDFDLDPRNATPAGTFGGYYSGSIENVADAEGFPYTRTLYTNDRTGRTKEASMPGATHALTSDRSNTHTIRTYFSSVDEAELVRVFGMEAPSAKDVHKIITYDANNVGAITYKDKSGKTIATAFDAGAAASSLKDIDGYEYTLDTLVSYITGNTRKSKYQLSAQKPLFFTTPKRVTVDYGLEPATLDATCATLCYSCDYTIEFILHNQDDPTLDSQPLATYTLVGGECAATAPLVGQTFDIDLDAETNYVLERRLSTHTKNGDGIYYLDLELGEIETQYESAFQTFESDVVIQQLFNDNNLTGLYDELHNRGYQLDQVNKQYIIPFNIVSGNETCVEYLFVPYFDDCEGAPDVNCQVDGLTWEGYFANYWTERGESFGDVVDGKYTFVYFENEFEKFQEETRAAGAGDEPDETLYKMYYAPGELDGMIQGLLSENSDRVTCEEVWTIWRQAVLSYKLFDEYENSGELDEDPDNAQYNLAPFKNNLLERFFTGIEALIESRRPDTSDNICDTATDGTPTFLKRDVLYGRINTDDYGPANPRLVAHQLVYLNTDESDPLTGSNAGDLLRILANLGDSAPISISDFNGLTDCDKYKLHKLGSEFAAGQSEDPIESQTDLISSCGTRCEERSGEFKQAIIDALFSTAGNSGLLIEGHVVTFNEFLGEYTYIEDATANTEIYDYSLCEIHEMVDGLVDNCKIKYCNFDGLVQGGELQEFTQTQLDNLDKVLNYDFEVTVNAQGFACSLDYDQINTNGLIASDAFTQLWTVNDHDEDCTTEQEVISSFDDNGNIYALMSTRFDKFSYTLNNGIEIEDETGTGKFAIVKYNPQGAYLWHNEYTFEITGDLLYQYTNPPMSPAPISLPGAIADPETELVDQVTMTVTGDGDVSFIAALYTNGGIVASASNWKLKHGNATVLEFDTTDNFDLTYCSTTYVYNFVAASISTNGADKWFRRYTESYPNFNKVDDANNVYTLRLAGMPVSIEKMGSNGTVLWASETVDLQSSASFEARSGEISHDASGNVYFLNTYTTFANPAVIEVSGSVETTLPANSINHVLIKYDASGNFSWIQSFPTTTTGFARIIAQSDHVVMVDEEIADLRIRQVYSPVLITENTISGVSALGDFSLLMESADQLKAYSWRDNGGGINSITVNLTDFSSTTGFDLTNSSAVKVADLYHGFGSNRNYIGYTGTSSAVNSFSVPMGGFLAPSFVLPVLPCTILDPGEMNVEGTYQVSASKIIYPTLCFKWTDSWADLDTPDDDLIWNPDFSITCEEVKIEEIRQSIAFQTDKMISIKQEAYKSVYDSRCPDPNLIDEDFTVTYDQSIHHYTLYYYDRAGNLVSTVPPEGIDTLKVSTPGKLADAKGVLPNHGYRTTYEYNSVGQLVAQETPDAGRTDFIYNDIGQLRFSQNARQQLDGTFSYQLYDQLGRVIEAGEYSADFNTTARSNRNDISWPSTGGTEVTKTVYTLPTDIQLPAGYRQEFLRNRISYTYHDPDGLEDDPSDEVPDDRVTTIYSYDPHGNVTWLIQDIPGLELKAVNYEYDLLNGNVKQVAFDQGGGDAFYHRYTYDGDNRIVKVETSVNGEIWEQDAGYNYFAHGPMKESIIGQDKIQQQDYIYTLHGWLKAINDPSTALSPEPGITRDAFAMKLNYYSGDYQNQAFTGVRLGAVTDQNTSDGSEVTRNLYNGNISAWENANQNKTGVWTRSGMQYTYDVLDRIKSSAFSIHRKETNDNIHPGEVVVDQFYTRKAFATDYTFDGNGNLLTLNRDDFDGERMDQLAYTMEPGKNRLISVFDQSTINADKHADDVEGTNNYQYDAIGNLIHNEGEEINIDWTVYGKVRSTTKSDQSGEGTEFSYDAVGNRVIKAYTDADGKVSVDYYVRDASGNVMAIYRKQQGETTLYEVPMYGTDRLGMYRNTANKIEIDPSGNGTYDVITGDAERSAWEGINKYYLESTASLKLTAGFDTGGEELEIRAGDISFPNIYARKLKTRQYELKDHLSNVRAVVSDMKQRAPEGESGFMPAVISSSDYYPFGMDRTPVVWQEVSYLATFEDNNLNNENAEFLNRQSADIVNADIHNSTEGTGYNKSQRLSGNTGNFIGLSKALLVKPGDKISAQVQGHYITTPNGGTIEVTSVLAGAIISGFELPGTLEAGSLQASIDAEFAGGSMFAPNNNTQGAKAYLNYLFFDNDFNLITGGFQSLGNDANYTDCTSDDCHKPLNLEFVPDQEGIVYVYLSDESEQPTEVYFDDFQVTHEVLIVDPQLQAYRYGFNGKEKDSSGEFGLNHYDYGFRIYNPGIAKFLSVDPLTSSYPWYTPYQFAGNKPIQSLDLDGLEEADYRVLTLPNGRKMAVNVNDQKSVENFNSELIRIKVQMGIKAEQEQFYKNLYVKKQTPNGDILKAIEQYWENYWDKLAALGDRVVRFVPISGSLLDLQDANFEAKMGRGSNGQQAAAFGWFLIDLVTMGTGGGKKEVVKQAAKKSTTIYRAIGMAELADIFQSRLIRPGAGSMETKLFSETFDDALQQGIKRGEDFAIIAIDVLDDLVEQLHKNKNLDPFITKGRTTFGVDPSLVKAFNDAITNFKVTPALKNTKEGVKVIR